MEQTALLKIILQKADAIKNEYGSPHLYASHIAAAVADFCKAPYTGLSVSDSTFFPARFEEERLRYIFSREIKLSAAFRTFLSRNRRNGVTEDEFDPECCQPVAAVRNTDILSADLVFLCALGALHPAYSGVVRHEMNQTGILRCLESTDANIYDYVIREVGVVIQKLQEKADAGAAIRDWKPAAKFAEPEALAADFQQAVEKKATERTLTLKFPKFFGTTDLRVTIYQADGIYYLHDNGCALRHLAKRVADSRKRERILQKVCHGCWIRNGRIVGSFVQMRTFLHYLQQLVFIAQGDLIYTRLTGQLYRREKGYVHCDEKQAEPLDVQALLALLRTGMGIRYEEDLGIIGWLDVNYSLFSGRMAILVETLDDGTIRISDKRRGKIEGEIFEAFYWDHDDLSQYSRYICKITDRFGAEFDGKDVYLQTKSNQFFSAAFRFFNMAVLLSELGHTIRLPK